MVAKLFSCCHNSCEKTEARDWGVIYLSHTSVLILAKAFGQSGSSSAIRVVKNEATFLFCAKISGKTVSKTFLRRDGSILAAISDIYTRSRVITAGVNEHKAAPG